MKTILLAAIAFASLAACKSDGPEGNPWYSMGDANYDSVKAAADACKAKGGDFQLKDGGDPTHLGDYACNPKKGS
jgi:hypothetical protein